MLRIAVPDLVSNSYFPAIAAVELGFFNSEGYDASIDLLFPIPKTFEALRDGQLDFVVGSAHATLLAFPEWQGAKLLAAVAQHTYWFLVIRSDLKPKHGDLSVVKGLRIGAAPGVNLSLQHMLVEAGIDPEKNNVQIMPIPGAAGPNVSFGLSAAKALEEGKLDGFWANGMGCEVAVRGGVGTMVLDVRRGDGPPAARDYTFSALVATDKRIKEEPASARAAIRARDFAALADVAEHNCLKMHAAALAALPPLVYWNGATVECLHAVRRLRAAGVPVFFTIDAGPQLKAVCAPGARAIGAGSAPSSR